MNQASISEMFCETTLIPFDTPCILCGFSKYKNKLLLLYYYYFSRRTNCSM